MMTKIAIATEERSSDLHRLAYSAIRAANSHDDDRCFDILRYMKQSLNLSVKDLCHSNAIPPLASLRDHENPKLRMEANLLFNSWMKTLFYSSGRNSSTCNEPRSRSQEKTSEIKQIYGDRKSFSVQAKKRRRLVKLSDLRDNNTTISSIPTKIHLKQHKPDASVQVLDKTDDQRSKPLETGEIQHKPEEDCNKSIAARSPLPMKLSENPRSKAHETGKIKQKPGACKSVLPTSRTTLQMKKKQAPLKDDSQNLKHCPALNIKDQQH